MKKNNLKRFLASLLAVLMLSQVTGVAPSVFADVLGSDTQTEETKYEAPQLRSGTAVIPAGSDVQTVNKLLAQALIANYDKCDPATRDNIEWEYECVGKSVLSAKNTAWGSIAGFESSTKGFFGITTTYTHPALAANEDGNYQVRIKGSADEVTLTKAAKLSSSISFNTNPYAKITRNDDLSIKFDELYDAVWKSAVAEIAPAELTRNDVTIEYYATAESGSWGNIGQAWMPLEGGKGDVLTYPAISEGTWKIRFTFKGNNDYYGFSEEVEVRFDDRDPAFELIEGVTELGAKFATAGTLDPQKTADAIREALVKKLATDEKITLANVKVEYATSSIMPYKVLDKDANLKTKDLGKELYIRLSWDEGTALYRPFMAETRLTLTDNRIQSKVEIRSDATITYNMDANVMLQAIFDNAIDWTSSTLPAKETLTTDDFVITYYAEAQIKSGTDIGDSLLEKLSPYMHKWVGIKGEENTILGVGVIYPQLGAGEQQIRIQYVGNAEYSPSVEAEGKLTVKKADVKVKVHSRSIYPNEVPGDDFVTLNPDDPAIDVYVIYGGVTSNLSGSIYLQLPSTNQNLVNAINKALEYMGKPPIQEGITVGELKAILNEIINFGGENSLIQKAIELILKQYGIDYGTLKNIINALNKLPSLSDNVRIVIGFPPNHAGLYLAVAVTDNENYNTAIGIGLLTVKMRVAGMKIQFNDNLTKKLTAEQAKELAADPNGIASLLYNGEAVKDPNLHFLYSGVQSNFRPYSSTTEFPTAPGRYVVTVVTLGGDYLAPPVTFTFRITK